MKKNKMRTITINSEKKPVLKLNEEILEQIRFLCRKYPSLEWSGSLFFTYSGTIKNISELVITAHKILPLDVGSSTYTEYSYDERYIDFIEKNEERDYWRAGHIHSHNKMSVFFSGTDISELEDNAPTKKPFYLSLIVNNVGDLCCKIAYVVNTKVYGIDEDNNNYDIEGIEDKVVIISDCDIVKDLSYDVEKDEEFMDFVSKIKEPQQKSSSRNNSWGLFPAYNNKRNVPNSKNNKKEFQTNLFSENNSYTPSALEVNEGTNNSFNDDVIEEFVFVCYSDSGAGMVDTMLLEDYLESFVIPEKSNLSVSNIVGIFMSNFIRYYNSYFDNEEYQEVFTSLNLLFNDALEGAEDKKAKEILTKSLKEIERFFKNKFEK